jgi:hypothetical protein
MTIFALLIKIYMPCIFQMSRSSEIPERANLLNLLYTRSYILMIDRLTLR